MRELNNAEVQVISGGYGTLGPGGGSDPGNQANDYGVNAGGLRYTPASTRADVLGTAAIVSTPGSGAMSYAAKFFSTAALWAD